MAVSDVADDAYALLVTQMAQTGAAQMSLLDITVQRLLAVPGATLESVERLLLTDLENEGRIFGDFLSGVRKQFDAGVKWTQERTEFAAWDDQAQRLGYDSAESMLQIWVLVSDNPCPDCIERAAMAARPRSEWVEMGLPGEGATICGPRCHCHMATVAPGSDGTEEKKKIGGSISRKGVKKLAKAKREGNEK